ncbi:MAG: hypothetical protein LBP41_00640 [Holosporaceae bacterium]|jgi:hypothetical protein|nr:hypothetical protein [Holosporaceae bacterium]
MRNILSVVSVLFFSLSELASMEGIVMNDYYKHDLIQNDCFDQIYNQRYPEAVEIFRKAISTSPCSLSGGLFEVVVLGLSVGGFLKNDLRSDFAGLTEKTKTILLSIKTENLIDVFAKIRNFLQQNGFSKCEGFTLMQIRSYFDEQYRQYNTLTKTGIPLKGIKPIKAFKAE